MTRQGGWKGAAVDLGASSGKVLLGSFDGERISVQEIRRFQNDPVLLHDTLYWDILRLYHEVKLGIQRAAQTAKSENVNLSTLGVDSWAVDFGLLDGSGVLMGNPVHYRDARTHGMMEQVVAQLGRSYIFRRTGIQFLPINTLYQLVALKQQNQEQLNSAATLLLIPDLIKYFLTGVKTSEFTNVTSTQLFDPTKMTWATDLLTALGIPESIFTPLCHAGDERLPLLRSVYADLDMKDTQYVSVASHDTASAVISIPSKESRFAYISSGTWSLLGTEIEKPNLSDMALDLNFTNEGSVGGHFRFLKNIMGLWILQELLREWGQDGVDLKWDEVMNLALQTRPFQSLIDPDNSRFLLPGKMSTRILGFCKETGQVLPETRGSMLRCILESLAFKYRLTLENMEKVLGQRLSVLHVVGGGIYNRLLCQWTANATGRLVVTGPGEGSGVGNLIVQLLSVGELGSLEEGRELIQASTKLDEYEPTDVESWDHHYERFKALVD